MPTSLRELLCDLYTWRREYEARVYRRAAAVAARKQADIFTAKQIEALIAFADGEIPIEAVFGDELHWGYVRGWSDEGERLAKEDDAKKRGIPAFARRMWDVAVPLVADAVERVLPGYYVLRNEQDRHVADYCCGPLANSLDSDDRFAQAVELLNRDGFTDTLLRELWRECSKEADYRELSRPRDTMPPMTVGHLRIDEAAKLAYWSEKELQINSHTDFAVLQRLESAKGAIVPFVELLRAVKPRDISESVQALSEAPSEVKDAVSHINKALKLVRYPVQVKNVRGQGYRLRSPDE